MASLARAGDIPSILVAGFDRSGTVVRGLYHRSNTALARKLIELLNRDAAECGLKGIAGPLGENLLIKAPSGFMFQKPSGSCSNYFIRTENAFVGMEKIAFMAYCLLPLVAAWEVRHGTQLDQVFVDSMSIASLVLTMAHLRRTVGGSCPSIKSFHGYDGLNSKSFRAPPPGGALAIISASSGWSLAQEWCLKTGDDTIDALTLVSFKTGSAAQQILHTVPRPADWSHLFDEAVDASGLGRVQIVGEHFLSLAATPKTVGIVTDQGPKNLAQKLSGILGADLFTANRHAGGSALPKELFADGKKLVTLQSFVDWVCTRIQDLPKNSINHIVYQDDDSSLLFAKMCEAQLQTRDYREYVLHSGKKISTMSGTLDGGVLIVAAIVGNGSRLLTISRDLRNRHPHGFRQYLVGISLGATARGQEELERNLKFAPRFAKYDVQTFRSFAIGMHRHPNSWMAERAQLEKIGRYSPNAFLRKRVRELGSFSTGLDADVFWPAFIDQRRLALREGFAFWGGKKASSSLCDLILTMKVVLQNCREDRDLPIEKRLASQTLQQVLLDPNIFLQYDDGAIQASILRAAFDAELDYSHDAHLSRRALGVLEHILTGLERTKGEASAEFLVAVLTGKLRLTQADLEKLSQFLNQLKPKRPAAIFIALFRRALDNSIRSSRWKSRKQSSANTH